MYPPGGAGLLSAARLSNPSTRPTRMSRVHSPGTAPTTA